MHAHAKLIEDFYTAFAKLDSETMAACYHSEIHFSDPVFPELRGQSAGNMWRMLCGSAKDLRIESSAIEASDTTGKAHWDAFYTFRTGRKVENRIDARFEFKDGLMIRHADSFDLWKWTRMALGPVGTVLGWTPIIKNKVRGMAAKQLTKFEADRNAPS